MKYVNSTIGVNDQVIINDINYFSEPGPSFTPGVGGTYKQPAPPSLGNEAPEGNLGPQEKVGCELARSAGWGTPAWCSEPKVDCPLNRALEPQRHIEPGRLDYLICALKDKKRAQAANRNATIATSMIGVFVVLFVLLSTGFIGKK